MVAAIALISGRINSPEFGAFAMVAMTTSAVARNSAASVIGIADVKCRDMISLHSTMT